MKFLVITVMLLVNNFCLLANIRVTGYLIKRIERKRTTVLVNSKLLYHKNYLNQIKMRKLVRLLLIVSCLMFSFALFSQSPLNHQSKMYKDGDGKLYVNKNRPMYLFLGTSPDPSSQKQRLESQSSPQYTNPFYFDTEGYNTIRTPSQVDTVTKKVVYPISDIIFEVYADGIAPVTKSHFLNSNKYVKDSKTYYCDDLKVNLEATDQTSGVENIYYSIDEQPFKEFTDTLIFNNEKQYRLKYYSVDHVGNVGELKTTDFGVDKTPPVVNWRLEGDVNKNVASGRSKIIVMAEDALSGVKNIRYKIGNQPEKIYKNGIDLSLIPSGQYEFRFWAEDNVGNISDKENNMGGTEATVYAFIVDQVPPTVSSLITGDQYAGKYLYVSPRSMCQLSGEDDMLEIGKIVYSFNGQMLDKIYEQPFTFENERGPQAVYYQSWDLVANKSDIGKLIVYMDNDEPATGINYSGPQFFTRDTLFINKETKIKLFSEDDESGVESIEYQVDGNGFQQGKDLKVETSGFHKIDFRAKDNVNNVEQIKHAELVVDNEAPEIFVNFSIKDIRQEDVNGEIIKVYPPYVKMYIGATDKYCGTQDIYFSVDGCAKRKYTGLNSPADVELFKTEKLYEVLVEANDKLGNSTTKKVIFRVAKK